MIKQISGLSLLGQHFHQHKKKRQTQKANCEKVKERERRKKGNDMESINHLALRLSPPRSCQRSMCYKHPSHPRNPTSLGEGIRKSAAIPSITLSFFDTERTIRTGNACTLHITKVVSVYSLTALILYIPIADPCCCVHIRPPHLSVLGRFLSDDG